MRGTRAYSLLCGGFVICVWTIGCATSNGSASEEVEDEPEFAEANGEAKQLETVRQESKRNDRERKRVDEAVDEQLDALTACYLRGVLTSEETRPRAELTFRWTIDSQGAPHGVQPVGEEVGETVEETPIGACISGVLQKVRFQTPESRSVEVEYPFDFQRVQEVRRESWYEEVHRAFRNAWEPPEEFRTEELEDEDEIEVIEEELRELANETYILIELSEDGAVAETRPLMRAGHREFQSSVDEALEAFAADGEERFPMPRGGKLRRLVGETGLVLHGWMPPEEESEDEERSGREATATH